MSSPILTAAEIETALATRKRLAALKVARESHTPYEGNPHERFSLDGVAMERHMRDACPLPGCAWCRPPTGTAQR